MEVLHLCLPTPILPTHAATTYLIDPSVALFYAEGVADPMLAQIGVAMKDILERGAEPADRLFVELREATRRRRSRTRSRARARDRGSPDDVARELANIAEAGFAGTTIAFVNYLSEFPFFAAEVLPRLWERDRAEGLRRLADLRQLTRGALAETRHAAGHPWHARHPGPDYRLQL